jgi:hypothetical protein
MKSRRSTILALCAATASLCAPGAPAQDAPTLVKPLDRYSVGDLFPRMDAGLQQTAEIWKAASAGLYDAASDRETSVAGNMRLVEQRIDHLQTEIKAAKRAKNFTAEGTARGQLETEETVYKILKEVQALSDNQRAVAEAWSRAADAISAYVAADAAFDPYRTSGIAKPVAGAPDTRLDRPGIETFRSHARAMDDLGKSFERLGEEIQSLVEERLDLLQRLEKGGHTMTPAMATGG